MRESGSLFYEKLLDLLFPRRCPICDEVLKRGSELICRDCAPRVLYVGEHYCMKCGKPLGEGEMEYCRDCRRKTHAFDRGRAVFAYRPVAQSIYRFKYQGRREYADFYAAEAVRQLGEAVRHWKPDALVPVPVHWKRRAHRGYNQAEVFARCLGAKMGIPVVTNLVKRCRNTRPQKLLNAEERQNNLKRAFIMARNDVKLNTIIIIDDIYTTGSTVDAMAKLLRTSGIKHIYVLTIAIGKG